MRSSRSGVPSPGRRLLVGLKRHAKLGRVRRVPGDTSQGLYPSLLELGLQVENRIGELGEDQHLPVRERLRQERVEGIKFGVMFRVPVPVSLKDVQQGVGIGAEFALQIPVKEVGAEPLEAFLVAARVLLVYVSGMCFELGRPPGANSLIDFLFLFVVVRVEEMFP